LEPERFAPIEVTTFLENRFRVQRFPAMRYRGPFQLEPARLVAVETDRALICAVALPIRRDVRPIEEVIR
jgi:hypothetical protein